MKNLLAAFLVAGLGTTAPAQGLVNFLNTSATLISSSGTAIQGPPGTYYFALLTAPVGTTDPALFTFSGAYGTNQATAGRFTGGVNVPIPGWYPGTTRAFMVAGWSASKGHDWNSNWVIGFGHEWYDGALGFSAISEGAAGGFDGTNNLPNLNVMLGSHGITSGFSVNLCCLGGWSGFTRQPTNQSVVLGGTAVFQATAIACPLPYYQWYFNGVPIAGAASNYYLITNVQPQHAGNYFAVLSNRWWGGWAWNLH